MSDRAKVEAALKTHPILAGLDDAARAELLKLGIVKAFAPGQYLSREGDEAWAYWLLCTGSVRVFYTSPTGLEVTVKLFGAPAAWAEMQVLHDYVHTEDCVAVDRATCLCVPKREFNEFLDAHPRFMKNVLVDAGARFLISAQHERALAFLKVSERLAYVLLAYLRNYGVPVEGGTQIRVRLSQEGLAADLGVARKSITRTLKDWLADGTLEKRGAYFVVTDLGKLSERAPNDILGLDWSSGRRMREGLP